MSVDAISAVEFLSPSREIKFESNVTAPGGFAAWVDKELTGINAKILDADVQMRKLAAGEVDNLHQVMVSMEEAKLSFQLALQVRNRLMEAYQDVLRMQI